MSESVNSTVPRATSVADIENQLREVWRELGEQHNSDDHAVTRVCTLTLVSYGANSDYVQRIRHAVAGVFDTHPARAITIEADGAENELSAWVSAVCQPNASDDEQMCCEQITLRVGDSMRRRLPSLVFPFVVSDLPMFVWYPGPLHVTSNIHNQLFSHSDRWIVDSNDFTDPMSDLAQLHQLISSDSTVAVSDMTWVRLTGWRTLFAQIFDMPDTRPTLDTMDSLTISTGAHPAAELLGLGWIASCLHWQFVSATIDESNTLMCEFRQGQRTISVKLSDKDHLGMALPSIVVKSSQSADILIKIERSREKRALTSLVDFGTHQRTQTSEYKMLTDTDILNNELSMYAHDRVYEQSLAVVAQLAAHLKGRERV